MTAIIHTIDALHDIASEADFIAKAVAALDQEKTVGLSFIIGRWAETLDALGNGLLEHVEAAERAGTSLVASAPSSE